MSLLGTATAVFWWCGDNHTVLDRFDKGHQPMHFEQLLACFATGPQDSHSLFAIALHRSRRCFITWEEQVVSDEKQWRWTWHPAQVSPLRISIPMRFKDTSINSLTFKKFTISKAAQEKIEAAGGKVYVQ